MKKINVNPMIRKIQGLQLDDRGVPCLTVSNIRAVSNYVSTQSMYASAPSGDFARRYFADHVGDRNLDEVILKVIIVDSIDSTNLKQQLGGNYYTILANRVRAAGIEELIRKGERIGGAFRKIAEFSKKNGDRKNLNLFIFLSKYITRVSEYSYGSDQYSILDGVIRDHLGYFHDPARGICIPNIPAMRDNYQYDAYCDVITNVLYQLPGVRRAELDQFVWYVFKEPTAEERASL